MTEINLLETHFTADREREYFERARNCYHAYFFAARIIQLRCKRRYILIKENTYTQGCFANCASRALTSKSTEHQIVEGEGAAEV